MRRELLFLTVLMICSCEADDPEVNVPSTPLNPETNTIPQQDAIRIDWDVGIDQNLAGYRLYRAKFTEENGFKSVAEVSEKDDYYEDADVSIGVKYYYRVSAFDDAGNESDKSDPVHYTLLEKPALIEPTDQTIIKTTIPTFKWLGVSGTSSYTVHVYTRAADVNTWQEIWRSEKIYPYQDLCCKYKGDEPLEIGLTYRWRVDASGGRSTGSQSRWRYFTVGQ